MKSKISKRETPLRRLYRQVPNFSFVPPEYKKPNVLSRRLLLRLFITAVIAVELFFIWNLYQEKASLEAAIDSSQLQIQQTEDKKAIVNAEKELRKERQVLQDDWKTLTVRQIDWPQILSAFLKSKPGGIELSLLTQDGELMNANGAAPDYTSLLQYRGALLGSPAISQINSLDSKSVNGSVTFSLSVKIGVGGR